MADFPQREFRTAHPLGQAAGNVGRDMVLAGMHGTDGTNQLLLRHVLEQVALRSRLQSPVDVFIAIVSGDHDDVTARELSPDG